MSSLSSDLALYTSSPYSSRAYSGVNLTGFSWFIVSTRWNSADLEGSDEDDMSLKVMVLGLVVLIRTTLLQYMLDTVFRR